MKRDKQDKILYERFQNTRPSFEFEDYETGKLSNDFIYFKLNSALSDLKKEIMVVVEPKINKLLEFIFKNRGVK